ncbi:hypothetical protein LTR70_006041 [Exophiala xenobiotica]|uniref:Major facilitator superfamily (MFS) profile domain-containing protein n=1 Tax=Lithohypha guttulata TaxID=1690604 RepID=A0ABR0KAT5_9EURO|nr:hypothetical protein LTR24_004767 [Lithohypha guttulata]KAK5317010.1 hypothetical protein LTR70_006041 [Exophiala xenobiotica]
MFPERGDLVSSRPTSRQSSATRSDVRQHGRSDRAHSDLARHDEYHSVTADGGAPRVPTEHNPSSNESEDEEEEKRQTRLTRANTLSKDYTEKEELAVIKEFDRKLVLFLAFLYLLSFLDRSNIGNARIAGLEQALQLSDVQFDYCLVAFYITYITFEWMILLYRLVPAHVYISLCVLAWGVVASLQSVVTSFKQLLALRACLGITEAAFGPGVPFYMTFFYRRSELAYRVGLQISAAPLATSFASSLAWVIVKLSQDGPIEPWRALFLFEGFPSIITAIFAWYFIPDSPETARYLTPRERKVARLRLREEQRHDNDNTALHDEKTPPTKWNVLSRLKSSKSVEILSSPIPWLQALIFLSINVSFASLPVFLPTIIRSMDFSALTSQILSAPPYLLSFAFVLLIGRLSDSIPDSRGLCLMACSGLSATSYFIIALFGFLESSGVIPTGLSIIVRYIAVYGAALGLFSSVVLIITWNLNNQPSRKEKGLAMMVMNVVGQCGPLVGVNLFPRSHGPYYVSGMLVSGFFMLGVVVLAGVLKWKLGRMNRVAGGKGVYEMVSLDEGGVEGRDENVVEEAEGLMGRSTDAPIGRRTTLTFRYML